MLIHAGVPTGNGCLYGNDAHPRLRDSSHSLALQMPAAMNSASDPVAPYSGGVPTAGSLAPVIEQQRVTQGDSVGVNWSVLGRNSVRFLGVMHAFRWATEPGTREGGIGLGAGYRRSVTNLHGWSDGDPFYVNYVGHPMQGAVSGRLFQISDGHYRRTEFGKSRDYWKGKLRAATFAWAFSEQFEVGLLSEASIGQIQLRYPQQGFVDHVITPSLGLAWMIGEDALDRYLVRSLEDRITNRWIRLALRSALNPTRSFANLLDGRTPWHRDSRAGIQAYRADPAQGWSATNRADRGAIAPASPLDPRVPAPFEFAVAPAWRRFPSSTCAGGGADVAYRVAPEVQIAIAVSGCKLLGLRQDLSGDALVYQVGPRWTPIPSGRLSPYAHVLIGGIKITHEEMYPEKNSALHQKSRYQELPLDASFRDQYTRQEEDSGVAISVGTGIDYRLNTALALRIASIEYSRSSARAGDLPYSNGLQFTTGMVLRLGTW